MVLLCTGSRSPALNLRSNCAFGRKIKAPLTCFALKIKTIQIRTADGLITAAVQKRSSLPKNLPTFSRSSRPSVQMVGETAGTCAAY
jgi:hypothetical protein